MKKFLYTHWVFSVSVLLSVAAAAILGFARGALVVAIAWLLYRVYKHIMDPCPFCHMPIYLISWDNEQKKPLDIHDYISTKKRVCYFPWCSEFLCKHEEGAHESTFSTAGLWWRKNVKRQLFF